MSWMEVASFLHPLMVLLRCAFTCVCMIHCDLFFVDGDGDNDDGDGDNDEIVSNTIAHRMFVK